MVPSGEEKLLITGQGIPSHFSDLCKGYLYNVGDSAFFLFGKLQEALDIGLNAASEELGAVPLERFSFRSHQELLKVPGDVIAMHGAPQDELWLQHEAGRIVIWVREFILQVGKDRMGVVAIHFTLLTKSKVGFKPRSGPHIFQAMEDLFICAVFLFRRK